MQNGAGDLQVAYVAGVTTGTQSRNIALSNVSAGTLAIAGVENLNITSGLVKSTLTALTDANMKSITVTGSTDLKITNALDFAADLTGVTGATDGTIDASDFTGKLNVTVTADEHSITGGSGNDTFNMAGTLNGYDKVVGGDGLDTLTMDAATITTQFTGVSGIETVAFNDTSTAYSIASNKLNGDVSQILLSVKDDTIDGNETAFAVWWERQQTTHSWSRKSTYDRSTGKWSVTITSTTTI
jgi:S-layer protein